MQTIKFKKLVRKYKDLIYSQALYSTGNSHDASDITQEVLIKLWNNMDNIRLQTVKSWLLAVTRNSCIDMSRKKREKYFSEFHSEHDEGAVKQIADESETDPEQNLDQYQKQQRIISAIAGLPENIRTSILLRYIHDETYDMIAKTLEVPINSIKVYLHRGRKLLFRKLKGTIEE